MIPKLFHFIWLGSDLPELTKNYINSFERHNPDYSIHIWNEKNTKEILEIHPQLLELYNKSKLFCQKADILRLIILYEFGGFYIDADVDCLKSFDTLLDNKFVIGEQQYQPPDKRFMYCNAIMGSVKNSNFMVNCINNIPFYMDKDRTSGGPKFLTTMIFKYRGICDITTLSRKTFYPFMWWERQNYNPNINAYTNHYWWGN